MSREDPASVSQNTGQSSCEEYFSTKFHHFCAKYFSSFQNFPPLVLDTVTTEFDENGAGLINIT